MTRAASNDSETKSEGKYDTRSTEENYFADGLAKKALAAAQAAKAFKDLPFEEFSSTQPINLGALVNCRSTTTTPGSFLDQRRAALRLCVQVNWLP